MQLRRSALDFAGALALASVLSVVPALGQQPPATLSVDFNSNPDAGRPLGVPSSINYGGTATFTVVVKNTSSTRAVDAGLTGTPPSPTLVTAFGTGSNGAGCSIIADGGSFACSLGDIPDAVLADAGIGSAAVATRTFTVRIALPPKPYASIPCPGGTVLGAASVTATAENAVPGTQTVDTSKSFNLTRTNDFADLTVKLTADRDTANIGDTITYTAVVSNLGACPANRVRAGGGPFVTAADGTQVPGTGGAGAGLVFQSNTGDCTSSFPCVLGSMDVGTSKTFTTSYRVDKPPKEIETTGEPNQVTVTSTATPNPDGGASLAATFDPDTTNNSDNTVVKVNSSTGCSSTTGTMPLLGLVLLAGLGISRRRTY
jgi:uncharacterized protein (TIGR03382 family)